MKILVINCGSSSLKYKLYEDYQELHSNTIENIGENKSKIKNHRVAIKIMIDDLIKNDIIKNLNEINAVGHRVVHGGKIKSTQIINQSLINEIKKNSILAPIHNPVNLIGIIESTKLIKNCKHVAVFDTAFHQTMPDYAKTYAIPYKFYKKNNVQRYGFHGISHKYMLLETCKLINKKVTSANIITCHLGNGSSIAAIKNGIVIDTSMGFTPLEGLTMGTRCGNIDPGIIFYMQAELKIKNNEIENILNKKSGLLGISGKSQDMRTLLENEKNNDKQSKLAIQIYCYNVIKYISMYAGILGNIDAIAIAAGIGENNPVIRKRITDIPLLNIKIDNRKNINANQKNAIISSIQSKIKVVTIKTDEEKMICNEILELLK